MSDIDWDAFNKGLTGKDKRTLEKIGAEEDDDENKNEYYEVPDGEYEVELTSVRLGVSKSGNQGAYINFEVLTGEEEGEDIFYYMGLDGNKRAWKFKLFCDFMNNLKSGVEFSYANFKNEDGGIDGEKLEDTIDEALGEIGGNKIQYGIKKVTEKGYTHIYITDVFDE